MSPSNTLLLLLLISLSSASLAIAAPTGDDARGRNLLNALGCKGCHAFEGSGGTIGPALDEVGKRLSTAEIETKLLAPKQNNPETLMPSYDHLPKADLASLAHFLAAQK